MTKHKNRPQITTAIFKILLLLPLFALTGIANSEDIKDDKLLKKLVEWHLGFATNQIQYNADRAEGVKPAWALSELRMTRIWHDREDAYWIYYEVSQPAVRPDRNEIWKLYRNTFGDLKVDVYRFNDTKAGLGFWGKWKTPKAFKNIDIKELHTEAGCNGTYHWLPELEKFSGINSHGDCPVGNGYILQHIEISKDSDGVLLRNDWHWFFDGDGVAKTGPEFKLGNMGAYRHKYTNN